MMSEEPAVSDSEMRSIVSWGISMRLSAALAWSDNGVDEAPSTTCCRLDTGAKPARRVQQRTQGTPYSITLIVATCAEADDAAKSKAEINANFFISTRVCLGNSQ
jgi:hypothetical protein